MCDTAAQALRLQLGKKGKMEARLLRRLSFMTAPSGVAFCLLFSHKHFTPQVNASQLLWSLQEMVLSQSSRRKLALHVVGANERKASDAVKTSETSLPDSTNTSMDSSTDGHAAAVQTVHVIDDMWAFKRLQSLFPCSK